MSLRALLEPIVEDGIKHTNYFEGRLLSARDLSEQQQANRQQRQQLGCVSGYGIVDGLDVSTESKGGGEASPVVRVAAGKAVNLDGDVLELPAEYVDVELSQILSEVDAADKVFRDCDNGLSEFLAPSGMGFYLLVISPAAEYQGYAQKSGLQKAGIANPCGRNYVVEGIQFRLVKFDPAAMPDVSDSTRQLLEDTLLSSSNPILSEDYQDLSRLQNIVAHVCFGTEASRRSQTSALTTVDNPASGIDALVGNNLGLESCDVPIALVYWTLDGIGYVDNWAVKRRVFPRVDVNSGFALSGQRGLAIFEAMLYQFHDQVEQLLLANLSESDLLAVSAADYFEYLPPAAILPLYNVDYSGFSVENFFSALATRDPLYISEHQARSVVYQCVELAPIATREKQLVWLYKTWQRDFAESQGQFSIPHVLFTSGHSPFFATPRFDLARWDYSNYLSETLGP